MIAVRLPYERYFQGDFILFLQSRGRRRNGLAVASGLRMGKTMVVIVIAVMLVALLVRDVGLNRWSVDSCRD